MEILTRAKKVFILTRGPDPNSQHISRESYGIYCESFEETRSGGVTKPISSVP